MPPDNGRSRRAGDSAASNDHTGSGIEFSVIEDLASVAGNAWQALTGLLLDFPPLDLARDLLADIPMPATDPGLNWWLVGVRLCVEASVTPSPMTAADHAIRAGFEAPTAFRGTVTSPGWALVAKATGMPMACAWDLVGLCPCRGRSPSR